MSALWGISGGIQAANELSNANMLSGLKAQEMMGAIAQQPADLAYKQAQARLLGAQASGLEATAEQQRMLFGLDAKFNAEYAARQTLIKAANAAGKDATVEDLTDGSAQKTLATGLYDKSLARIKWMEESGVPESIVAAERDKISIGLEHQAIGADHAARASREAMQEKNDKLIKIGGIANYAASSPKAFAQSMMNPETAAVLPKGMHLLSYEQAHDYLKQIAGSSQTAVQQLAEADKQATATARDLRDKHTRLTQDAQIKAADSRVKLADQEYEDRKKNGGERSPEAAAAKTNINKAREAAAEARLRKEAPPLLIDPEARAMNQIYTLPDGRRARWEINPETKKLGLNVVPFKAPSLSVGAARLADTSPEEQAALTADDTGD